VAGNSDALPLVEASRVIDRWIAFDDSRVTRLFVPGLPAPDDAFLGLDAAVAWCADPDGTLRAALERRGASQVVVAPSRPPSGRSIHVSSHLLQSLAPLRIAHRERLDLATIDLPHGLGASARTELAAAGLHGQPFVAIHPGSGSAAKNWPVEQFARVVEVLAERHRLATLILAGPADGDVVARLCAHLTQPPPVLANRPLLLVAAILRQARAFLGNDSGLAHLAGLLDVPTLALFGPTDPKVWSPLGPRVRVIRAEPLAALTPASVLAALTDLTEVRPWRAP
jgi:hypothetical protein